MRAVSVRPWPYKGLPRLLGQIQDIGVIKDDFSAFAACGNADDLFVLQSKFFCCFGIKVNVSFCNDNTLCDVYFPFGAYEFAAGSSLDIS